MKKLVLLSALVLCLCGCSSNEKKVEELEQLEVSLKGNATTGYSWKCVADNEQIAKVAKTTYVEDESKGATGVGGTYRFVFEGTGPGMTTISCTYNSAVETEEPTYEIRYVLKVSEEKEVTVDSKTGTYSETEIPTPVITKTTK